MSVLVVGLSHRSAPMDLLETVALSQERCGRLAEAVHAGDAVGEAIVVATCNRVEVYSDAVTFHGAVAQIGHALAEATGVPLADLRDHLYVHFEERAVAHAFSVACGLDSMAVGEGQILGQLRTALSAAQANGRAGTVLGGLFQQALRVGKRAHAETDIDAVSRSLVHTGLDVARAVVDSPDGTHEGVPALAGRRALVVGAGAMSGLAAATVARETGAAMTIINRTRASADRLALAHGAQVQEWADLPQALAATDVVLSCTGALGHVITADMVAAARHGLRDAAARPLVLIDLALPRDVDPAAGELDGVTVLGLAELGETIGRQAREQAFEAAATDPADDRGRDGDGVPDAPEQPAVEAVVNAEEQVKAVQDLVNAEVAAYLTHRRRETVAPTVAALRSRAATVVAAELTRLDKRVPDMDPAVRDEVGLAVHRVVEKLLHAPTVRVKEFASTGARGDYAQALRDLFDLDPHDVVAVATPPVAGPEVLEGGVSA